MPTETFSNRLPCGCVYHQNRMPEGFNSAGLYCEDARKLYTEGHHLHGETALEKRKELVKQLQQHLGVKPGEWTPDFR